jgi:hypothetical protein
MRAGILYRLGTACPKPSATKKETVAHGNEFNQ